MTNAECAKVLEEAQTRAEARELVRACREAGLFRSDFRGNEPQPTKGDEHERDGNSKA